MGYQRMSNKIFDMSGQNQLLSDILSENSIVLHVIVSGLCVIITNASHPLSAVRKMAEPAK